MKFCSDVYAEYKWVDEEGQIFSTSVIPNAPQRTATLDYAKDHELYVSNFVAESMGDAILKVTVYGRKTAEAISLI